MVLFEHQLILPTLPQKYAKNTLARRKIAEPYYIAIGNSYSLPSEKLDAAARSAATLILGF
jgi:hypothetical protein